MNTGVICRSAMVDHAIHTNCLLDKASILNLPIIQNVYQTECSHLKHTCLYHVYGTIEHNLLQKLAN